MKPHAHTASLSFSVGAPWEIWRTRSNITGGYVVDLYTKSGSDDLYQAHLVTVPAFNIVLSFLSAGPEAGPTIQMAIEETLQAILPVLNNISRRQAKFRYAGRYKGSGSGDNSSLVLSVDDDGVGLLVQKWLSRGVDVLAAAQQYASQTGSGTIRSVRLYPISSRTTSVDSRNATRESFRAAYEKVPDGFDPSVPRILKTDAGQWSSMDELMYGEIGTDDFVFALDNNGVAVSVEPRVMRTSYKRVG